MLCDRPIEKRSRRNASRWPVGLRTRGKDMCLDRLGLHLVPDAARGGSLAEEKSVHVTSTIPKIRVTR
jgi:hypothetical protein